MTHQITAIPVLEGSEAASCPPVPAPTNCKIVEAVSGLQQGQIAMPALPIQDIKVACVVDMGKLQRHACSLSKAQEIEARAASPGTFAEKANDRLDSKREAPSAEIYTKKCYQPDPECKI